MDILICIIILKIMVEVCNMVEALCWKCKKRSMIVGPEYSEKQGFKGPISIVRGSCSVCGSNVARQIRKEKINKYVTGGGV